MLPLAVLGCQGQDLSVGGDDPLTAEEVENVPAGSAVGSDASGAYLFTGYDIRSCSCRVGSDEEFCGSGIELNGDGLWVRQDEGAVEVRLFEGIDVLDGMVLEGGLDDDGAVHFGGVEPVLPGGQTFNLVQGSLASEGAGELRWVYRAEVIIDAESFDCDVVADISVAWWDPNDAMSCGLPADCHPERPYCGDGACSDGADGAACGAPFDCQSDVCVDGVCGPRGEGEPCSFPGDCTSNACVDSVCAPDGSCAGQGCSAGEICFADVCQAGVEGDPCALEFHCGIGLACVGDTCYDGSEGDPCDSSVDCDLASGFVCTADSTCG